MSNASYISQSEVPPVSPLSLPMFTPGAFPLWMALHYIFAQQLLSMSDVPADVPLALMLAGATSALMLPPSVWSPTLPEPSGLLVSSTALSPSHQAAIIPVPIANPVPPTQYVSASQQWLELLSKFLKVSLEQHLWEWQDSHWLPVYRYQKVDKIANF